MEALIAGGYYIKARVIKESEVAHATPCVRETWDYLLREANWKGRKSHGKSIKRGQLVRTYKGIIDALYWRIGYRRERYTKTQMKTAMNWLRKRGMITTAKTTIGLVVTVVNYATYQDPKNYERHSEATNVHPIEDHSGTPNDFPMSTHLKQEEKEINKKINKNEREKNKESKPGDAPCSFPIKITKNVSLDSALEITNTFIDQVGVRFPSLELVYLDQLNHCLRIIAKRLRARSYTADELVLVINFLDTHEDGEFRWGAQVQSLNKLLQKPRKKSSHHSYTNWMDVFLDKVRGDPKFIKRQNAIRAAKRYEK